MQTNLEVSQAKIVIEILFLKTLDKQMVENGDFFNILDA